MNLRSPLSLLIALWPPAIWAAAHRPALGDQVMIVTNSGTPAYDEVLESLQKGLSRYAVCVVDLHQKEAGNDLGEGLRLKSLKLVISIGSEAAEAVTAQHPAVPLIATATLPQLFAKETSHIRMLSVLSVQVPLSLVLENVKRVFPAKSRLGIIRNPALADAGPESMKAEAEAAGFSVRVVECSSPGRLLDALQSLKDHVDLVLCFPDAALYNSATVKPLVLASLRYRLPLIGFSESFVRAGAVAGVYPDFREAGTRAAELAQRTLSGQPVSKIDHLRKCRVAVNQNISRLLGLSFAQPPGAGEEFIVIR
jgi:putative ABC transport system substrate-binding protein